MSEGVLAPDVTTSLSHGREILQHPRSAFYSSGSVVGINPSIQAKLIQQKSDNDGLAETSEWIGNRFSR
jgi:hypothetical protein